MTSTNAPRKSGSCGEAPGQQVSITPPPRAWPRPQTRSSPALHPQPAFRYLSWILFPLLGCYAVYSLLYLEHKGWYSWVLSMLYGFLLTFGERPRALSSPS